MEQRARELGRPLSTLLRNAGFSEDLVRKRPSAGRRLDSLEKIATALNWTLPQLLGIVDGGRRAVELDPKTLRTALLLADRILRTTQPASDRKELLAELVSEAYGAILALEQDRPGSSTSAETLSVLDALLRRYLSRRESPTR